MAGVPSSHSSGVLPSGAGAGRTMPSAGHAELAEGLRLYAAGIDTSDYVARVAPAIAALGADIGDLLDIGAGGGQLGSALREPGRRWIAVEPSAVMHEWLRRLDPAPELIVSGWPQIADANFAADTVLAANMPAPLTEARAFLRACKGFARRRVIWVVPAQKGPRGLCLAGCLLPEWHREDETPGIDLVLAALDASEHPPQRRDVSWTFRAEVPDLRRLSAYLADRLRWADSDERRPLLFDELARQAEPCAAGFRLSVPKISSVLIWGA